MTVYELIQELAKFDEDASVDEVAFMLLHRADIAPKDVEDLYIEYLNKQKEVAL